MGGIGAFVTKYPVEFEDFLQTAHHTALEEQLRRDPQVEVGVEGVGVRDERPGRRAPGQCLQHRRLDLEEAAPFQAVADRADDGDPLAGNRAGLRANDEVDVALTDPRFLAHLLVGHRQRPQCLGRHLPGIGEHGQFAAPGTDDLAVDEHDVAEVHLGLPGLQGVLTHPGQADHRLKLDTVAFLQGGEAELSRVAGEHHPAGDPDDLAGRRVGLEIGVGGSDLGQRRGARDGNRVGLAPLFQKALPFSLPDPKLLRNIVTG